MITRLWRGWTTVDNADAYERADIAPIESKRVSVTKATSSCSKRPSTPEAEVTKVQAYVVTL